jgi:hypothetical protein
MTERTFTRNELMQAAEETRYASSKGVQDLLDYIERKEHAALVDASLKAPAKSPVPEGFLRRAVDANGFNIGQYTFEVGDKHYWLPPEEARKERPDIQKGILHTDALFAA